MTAQIPFDNSYVRLPENFYARVLPTPTSAPHLVKLNRPLARQLGLDPDALETPEGAEILAGKRIPLGAEPIAMAYAGHQFGNFVPQLGDGRAILLGEVVDRDGIRRDIQLKGSGPTPFSRRGDGRAALGPVLREYVVSEAMAVTTTGARVVRETDLPGAVLTRVAASHIRIGTFQFFAARGDVAGLKSLGDHAIARHYPDAALSDAPYRALLDGVIARQADLVARWMLVGFIHGVMNTDNMSISGETIDYGPCAFMDAYDPATVFSSIDQYGRYAFSNQPGIAQWNLTRLAECLLPLLAEDQEAAIEIAQASLASFADIFHAAYLGGLSRKIGLTTAEADDAALAQDLLGRMATGKADYTLTFRRLADAAADPAADEAVRSLFAAPETFDDWAVRWRERLSSEDVAAKARRDAMREVSPAVIPRNARIEAVITAAVQSGDFAPFEQLVAALAEPYADRPAFADYAALPPIETLPYRTFCGT
jgi:uncharacterized protein YdiU (UPF0061 family)